MTAQGSREFMEMAGRGRHGSVQAIIKYFAWDHLPERLQPISRSVADTALNMLDQMADSPELVTGLRKLLEAKDCFVRAALD